MRNFVDSCLQIRSSDRSTVDELVKLPIFESLLVNSIQEQEDKLYNNIISRKMDELYYLWQLAGGDMTVELKKQGLIRSRPPILSLPKYNFVHCIFSFLFYKMKQNFLFRFNFGFSLVILLGQMFGRRDSTRLLDLRVVKVSLDTLRQRLSEIPYISNFPRLNHK